MVHTPEPSTFAPTKAILVEVVGLVSKGFYFYAVTRGPEDDMPAFEDEMKPD